MSRSIWILGLSFALLGASACQQDSVPLSEPDAARIAVVDSGQAIPTDAGCEVCLPNVDAGAKPPKFTIDASTPSHCKERKRPDCSKEKPPCTWVEAEQKLPVCVQPGVTPYFQQRCGDYDAFVVQGTDSLLVYFYDNSGALVATADVGIGGYQCIAFVSSFEPPDYENCRRVTPKCSVTSDEDAGS